ncbi:unnamed protein product [Rotaria socialis]|uniref:Uncharacterized protein n=1 Tax=Rotaria socialis TaxID=392032 RepID=A0A821ACE9_9BILA|nr:unnamed protein product [Rotaria socialis]CAF4572237.1 unnamed protein product [Rotaria socialis]
MYTSMVAPLNSKQINTLLNTGLNGKPFVDEIIEKLGQISSGIMSAHFTHDFIASSFVPRVNQILTQWGSNDHRTMLNENDSKTLLYSSHTIFHMSNSIDNQPEIYKDLLDTVKICLNNISSFGFYITKSNQEDDSNLVSFDCLIYVLERSNMIENNTIREQLVEKSTLSYLIKYAEKWPNNESSLEIMYAIVFTEKGKEEQKKEQYKEFNEYVKRLYLSSKDEIRQAVLMEPV